MEKNKAAGQILLLETPFLSQTGTEETKAYVHSKYNLALLSLGSYIRAHSALKVYLINMVKDRIAEDSLIEKISKNPPAVVGIPLYSYNLSISYKIIKRIKQIFPETHICVGGPHVSIFPKETILLKHIDSIVIGDGEVPFLEICQQVINNGKLDQNYIAPGTYTKESVESGVTMNGYVIKDLNSLPLPDLTLLGDHKRYRDFFSNKIMGILTTSRGCPFKCYYCWSEKSRYRSFSIEHIMTIMRDYKERAVEYIEFWDDTFNPNKKRLDQFADTLQKENLGLTWSIRGAVVQHISFETMVKLKKMGLRIIQFGVETGNERFLKYLNKRIDHKKVQNAIDACHSAGVRTVVNMMINLPGQNKKEILDDFRMLQKIKPTYININIYNWAPGTIIYENALKEKTLTRDFWREHSANPVGEDPVIHPKISVPWEEVYKLRNQFITRYYFNSHYMYRYLKMIDFSEVKYALLIVLLMLKTKMLSVRIKFKKFFLYFK